LEEPGREALENALSKGNVLVFADPESPTGKLLQSRLPAGIPWPERLNSHQYGARDLKRADAFYLENDERLFEFENRSVPENEGLEGEIIRQGRTLITDDYERECRNLNLIPNPKGVYAWIGVPLNTGADTIGVLSTGSRDPSVIFTSDQANLVQAIADQAAGAILKAGLLEEAERRALQLATLNEVAQSLSSTLELVPLFNQILRSAVEILNCAAGSLLPHARLSALPAELSAGAPHRVPARGALCRQRSRQRVRAGLSARSPDARSVDAARRRFAADQ